ncbi:MAG: universal stress protein [Nitrospirota bacterium]|nr:universal stress protein [Nitrospirota bacterium]MDH5768438.1 universal stress protein [Nitrospirota bacterium]
MVATDGSEQAMKAVERGLELAKKEGAKVTLMSVAYYAGLDDDEMPLNIRDKLDAQAMDALKKAKALFDEKAIAVETAMEAGIVPANNIIRKAEEGNFDLILVGSSGLERGLLGSTSTKVVSHAPCSVTVVR